MARIFLSSTIYDLIDARGEVEKLLRDMKLIPVLSESANSDFIPSRRENSIETCLTNVRASDVVIVLLCQRYGPSLGAFGFEDVSATHLEYLEAVNEKKPIHLYVRDRLDGEYRTWRKNKGRDDVKYNWIQGGQNARLFEIVHAHQQLVSDKTYSNWYDTFSNTIELKALIKRDLRLVAGNADLQELIRNSALPMLDVSFDNPGPNHLSGRTYRIAFRNAGTAPAYNIQCIRACDGLVRHAVASLPPGGTSQEYLRVASTQDWQETILLRYLSPEGHCVEDTLNLQARQSAGTLEMTITQAKKVHTPAKFDFAPCLIDVESTPTMVG